MCTHSKTGGLALNLRIIKDAEIMLLSNLDIEDCLINGKLDTVLDKISSSATIYLSW